MTFTNEQHSAADRLRALPGRDRVVTDSEGWPITPGRAGRIEVQDTATLAVYTDRPRLFAKVWSIPGVRRHQTGDTEMRAVFPPEALRQVAQVIGAKRKRSLSAAAGASGLLIFAVASGTTKQEPSAPAMSKPDQTKGEKKSPAAKDGNLTAQHLPIGAVVETKSGKTGVITHVHKKAGYLFIKNQETGMVYHVSSASVTKVNGKSAAEIAENGGSTPEPEARAITPNAGASPAPQYGLSPLATALPIVAEQAAKQAARSGKGPGYSEPAAGAGIITRVSPGAGHGMAGADSARLEASQDRRVRGLSRSRTRRWAASSHVDVDGTLINNESGSAIEPDKAAEYLRGFHSNSAKQTEILEGLAEDYEGWWPGQAYGPGGRGSPAPRGGPGWWTPIWRSPLEGRRWPSPRARP